MRNSKECPQKLTRLELVVLLNIIELEDVPMKRTGIFTASIKKTSTEDLTSSMDSLIDKGLCHLQGDTVDSVYAIIGLTETGWEYCCKRTLILE